LQNGSGEAGGWDFLIGSDISRRVTGDRSRDPRYGGKDHLGRSLYHPHASRRPSHCNRGAPRHAARRDPQATFWRRDHAV